MVMEDSKGSSGRGGEGEGNPGVLHGGTPGQDPTLSPVSPPLGAGEGTNSPNSAEGPIPATTNGTLVTPNVYLIGLEFVRQYYTVLHQGPLYLHRFYAENSAYVHDDSKVIYGQRQIRDRIQQLNFNNCVAKILQVDSQETLSEGVVIQVRGELSNNDQPLRRFMQTFVLAPQSPKRYYVRNDIFHYQDELSKEDLKSTGSQDSAQEDDENDKSEEEEDELIDEPSSSTMTAMSVGPGQSCGPPITVSIRSENTDGGDIHHVSLLDATHPTPAASTSRRDNDPSSCYGAPSHGFTGANSGAGTTPIVPEENKTFASVSVVSPNNTAGPGSIPSPPSTSGPIKDLEQVVVTTPNVTGPGVKTYANLFKSGLSYSSQVNKGVGISAQQAKSTAGVSGQFSPPSLGVNNESVNFGELGQVSSPPATSPQPPTSGNLPPKGPSSSGGGNSYGRGRDPYPPRDRRDNRERLTSRSSNSGGAGNDDTGSVDGDNIRRSINSFPDSHQLFVGNLPHTVTQEEMKEIFSPYGPVAEVKILKPNQKNAGAKVPYFCFVVFDDAASAQNAIENKSKITMKMADGSNRRLNVEEKRAREVGGFSGGNYVRDRERENLGQGLGGNSYNRSGAGGQQQQPQQGMRNPSSSGGAGASSDNRSNPPQQQPRTYSRTFKSRGGGTTGERGSGGGGGTSGAR